VNKERLRFRFSGRLLAEAMAIVGSILLAFAIDAWWEDLSDRREEHAALQALAADFEAAVEILLRDNLAVHDSAVSAASALLELTGPNEHRALSDSLGQLIPAILRLPNFRPPLGTLDALIGSGDLRLIDSDSLRAALASFPAAVADYNRTQGYSGDVVFGSVYPYLSRRVPIREFGLFRNEGSAFNWSATDLLSELEFENLVQIRLTNSQFASEEGRAMSKRIERILVLLESELQL